MEYRRSQFLGEMTIVNAELKRIFDELAKIELTLSTDPPLEQNLIVYDEQINISNSYYYQLPRKRRRIENV